LDTTERGEQSVETMVLTIVDFQPVAMSYGQITGAVAGDSRRAHFSKRHANLSLETARRDKVRTAKCGLEIVERFLIRQIKHRKAKS
jgi:hypothetical protein